MSGWHAFALSPFLIPREFDKVAKENKTATLQVQLVWLFLTTSRHILIHLRRAFPVCPESSHGNVIAMRSQRIDLCDESRLSDGD